MYKVGDTVTSLGKPGIVVDVLTSTSGEQAYIKMMSADLIARNADGNGGELIDVGYHLTHCDKEKILKSADGYIKLLESRIEKLREFKERLSNES
jgi:hypothetical protein